MSLQTDLQAAVDSAEANAAKLAAYINGPAAGGTSLVAVDSGNLKTLARQQAEHDAAVLAGVIGPAPWATPVAFANGIVCTPATTTTPATAFTYLGETYVCVIAHTTSGGAPDLAKVIKVAAKGDPGDPGDPGADGADGLNLGRALVGLKLSTPGASADLTVAAGLCIDESNAELMTLAAALTKGTGAWVVGNNQGGLDTGAIANNTTYHRYLIKRPDTGVVDVCCSLSAAGPTVGGASNIPAAYTRYRRLGSIMTNGSAQWQTFLQFADRFYTAATLGASGASGQVLVTLAVPTGIVVLPLLYGQVAANGGSGGSTINVAPAGLATSVSILAQIDGSASTYAAASAVGPPTNTSAQIYYSASGASIYASLFTTGWIDRRGQDG